MLFRAGCTIFGIPFPPVAEPIWLRFCRHLVANLIYYGFPPDGDSIAPLVAVVLSVYFFYFVLVCFDVWIFCLVVYLGYCVILIIVFIFLLF